MADKATGERRQRLREVLLILASLAMVLAFAAPALTQEGVPVTGIITKPEITSYQYGTHLITDEATGTTYALESGSVDLDAYLGQRATISGAPVPGYQDSQIEGGPDLLNVTGVDPAAQPSDPVVPISPDDPSGDPPAPADEGIAIQAAEAARQASEIAQSAEQSVQQAADLGDPQAASLAAGEAQQASEVAQVAAEEAQQAAEQNGDPDARVAAQEARLAAEEAQEASGVAHTISQVARQATQKVAGIEETYDEALQAARSAGEGEDNLAFAAEYGSQEFGVDSQDAATKGSGEDAKGAAAGGKKTDGKKAADNKAADNKAVGGKDAGESGSVEDTGGVGSNTSTVTTPARGSVPLLLGGGVLLVAGIFVARKLIR